MALLTFVSFASAMAVLMLVTTLLVGLAKHQLAAPRLLGLADMLDVVVTSPETGRTSA